ncbi:leucine-rich repeat receptor-like protein kinase TDR, partial [Tanacetum coccineum]
WASPKGLPATAPDMCAWRMSTLNSNGQFNIAVSKMQAISKGLEKASEELSMAENDAKAEYMSNGSLDELLHEKNKCDSFVGDWVTRYNISFRVAQGICYLHRDCDPVVVHHDLKPRNILLDGDMEARVGDFGVANLIHCDESMSMLRIQ